MKQLALVLLTLPFLAAAATATATATDPLTASIDSSDAQRFAAVFKTTNGKPTAEQLQRGYLDGGGPGVAIFTPHRIENAAKLAAEVAKDAGRYRHAIEHCLPLLPTLTGDLRAIYLAYAGLLPERPLPAVHVVFGSNNSGGTASPSAQVLGLEVMCGPGTTAEQFRRAMRAIFAHETVHSWQGEPTPAQLADVLLFVTLREGVPDYLASLVTGNPPDAGREVWARPREAALWQEWLRDAAAIKAGSDARGEMSSEAQKVFMRWFNNYGRAPEGWPAEAGYWIGLRLAERYVAQAADKRAAIRVLVELSDPAAILQAGGAPR